MSISFNHPKNTVTSTGSLNLTVTGGSTAAPQPIRFNSTSVIMPVRALPAGEAGAMVFDTGTKTMKYHNGLSWVELLSQDVILEPIYNQLTIINQKLAGKVDSVTYSSSNIPQATINGTQLNIVFPNGNGGSTTGNGLFTSCKQGSIQHYALTSGMNAATIREQMSGAVNGQSGRNGSQSAPWKTNDGWCFADGQWWTWAGESGTVTQIVPNLNQAAYLKPMTVSGVTQISTVIGASAQINGTSLSIAQLPPHNFQMSGQTSTNGDHYHASGAESRFSLAPVYSQRTIPGAATWLNGNGSTDSQGNHIHTFSGTTNTLGNGESHTHTVGSVDVAHFNTAVIYNIATPSFALNEAAANGKYVLKAGDVMTGSLTIATAATIKGDDNSLTLSWRNNANAERAMIYHNTTNNTLRFRSNGGTEMSLTSTGALTTSGLTTTSLSATSSVVSGQTSTVGGKNVVRSVNNINADSNGNVVMAQGSYVSGCKFGVKFQQGVADNRYIPGHAIIGWANGNKKELRGASYWTAPVYYLVGSTWTIFSND